MCEYILELHLGTCPLKRQDLCWLRWCEDPLKPESKRYMKTKHLDLESQPDFFVLRFALQTHFICLCWCSEICVSSSSTLARGSLRRASWVADVMVHVLLNVHSSSVSHVLTVMQKGFWTSIELLNFWSKAYNQRLWVLSIRGEECSLQHLSFMQDDNSKKLLPATIWRHVWRTYQCSLARYSLARYVPAFWVTRQADVMPKSGFATWGPNACIVTKDTPDTPRKHLPQNLRDELQLPKQNPHSPSRTSSDSCNDRPVVKNRALTTRGSIADHNMWFDTWKVRHKFSSRKHGPTSSDEHGRVYTSLHVKHGYVDGMRLKGPWDPDTKQVICPLPC